MVENSALTVEQNYMISIDELERIDPSFNKSGFIAKVDNTFIMLYSSIMIGNLDRVKHKLSDDLIIRYQKVIDELNSRNERQMYDEINVKSTEILSISEDNDKYIIEVLLVSRYMDYIIDRETRKFISGVNDHRIEKNNYLTFTKVKDFKDEGFARKCPGCGANIDANYSGKCAWCGTTYDTVKYDWILEDIKTN